MTLPHDGLLPAASAIAAERISIAEAAKIARVSVRTMRRYAVTVDSLAVKIGGTWRVCRLNVEILARIGTEGYLARLQARRAAKAAANADKTAKSDGVC
jgi:hypothetical protein